MENTRIDNRDGQSLGNPAAAAPEYWNYRPLESHPRILFVKLSQMARAPTRSTEGAIGYDLYTPFDLTLYPREVKLVYTDVMIKVPLGHYGSITPKSRLTLKHHITVLAGVIDPDYTGNVGVVLHKYPQIQNVHT